MCSHPELIAAWARAVPSLPRTLNEMRPDVTPAPASRRDRHQLVTDHFLHDRRTQRFLSFHVDDVGALIKMINDDYNGAVPILLTGQLSYKSANLLAKLGSVSGISLDYVGTWVSTQEGRFAKVETAVDGIAPRKQVRKVEQKGGKHPFSDLRAVQWSKETAWTYVKVADAEDEEVAIADLRELSALAIDSARSEIEMQPTGSVRRALQNRFAEDLGPVTTSVGEGDERHLVVNKR